MYARTITAFLVAAMAAVSVSDARAAVVIEAVSVGNPGNANDKHGAGYGGVDYAYSIGTYEVTAGHYTEFLNAVAATDTYGLYNGAMWSDEFGCKIQQAGSSGSFTYSVAGDWADRPVNFVSWGDAARFSNWLHNGQPTDPQNLTTTEDGSYFLDGAMTYAELVAVVREPDATWVIPSEDEWYKAAYYDGAGGVYYDYTTSSDALPSNDLVEPNDPGNNATFYAGDYTIDSPYWRTEVGAHENSDSPCGTFDQGGNVSEWNEAALYASHRVFRGGAFDYEEFYLHVAYRQSILPTSEFRSLGFRVADVSEQGAVPTVSEWGMVAMVALLLGVGVFVMKRRGGVEVTTES